MTNADDDLALIELPAAPADQQALIDDGGVACWSEPVTIGTYEPGEPDRYPLFLDRRVYQGSSGAVYPIPFVDRIAAEKTPRAWQAVHLENRWVRLMLLPEIGGRIHIGYDKTRGYDFFYRNNVIKPALVGLAGPWVSGGVEFNWPQHHRPATFLPVDTAIERTGDGDVTVWHSDLDPLQRMRGSHGVRLRGDRSTIEVAARLHNRTDEPQTFLWWANVAARAHENYQSFFPTDVRYVADHARRAITAFPRADRPYYGVDYPALAAESHSTSDRLDFYANIPVPTSYMITDTQDDFFGGYDHDARAGFVHWADRSISPGKKQWTWGDGAIGRAWDAQLTDGDGPYVELMAGVYTDNQPDFSYLAPGETREFSQFWFPIQEIGPAHQATRSVAVSLEVVPDAAGRDGVGHDGAGRVAHLGVSSAIVVPRARVVLSRSVSGELQVVGEWRARLEPGVPFLARAVLEPETRETQLTLSVLDGAEELIRWTPRDDASGTTDSASGAASGPDSGPHSDALSGSFDEPWIATEPPLPADIASADELYLTGLHLQQYRHPTRSAVEYFDEVLRRDPLDSRAAVAVGAWHHSRGDYPQARALFERALERLTRRNLNPASGEASYRLGLTLERLGLLPEAAARLAKAGWDASWAHPAALASARLALRIGRPEAALEHALTALRTASVTGLGTDSPTAGVGGAPVHLTVLALRSLGRHDEAERMLAELRERDPLDPTARALELLAADEHSRVELGTVDPKTPLVVACELARCGLLAEALRVSDAVVAQVDSGTAVNPDAHRFGNPVPVAHYLRAQWLDRLADAAAPATSTTSTTSTATSSNAEAEGAAVRWRVRADSERAAARAADVRLAFPAGLDEHDALRAGITAARASGDADSVAPALLGAWLLAAGRVADALDVLRDALAAGSVDPVAWRNAAIAIVNSGGSLDEADAHLDRALELSSHDARLVFERDVLARLRQIPPEKRLAAIDAYGADALDRDDLTLSRLDLLLTVGRVDEALAILSSRRFQPFEGGEGQVIAAYDRATLTVARRMLADDPAAAARLLRDGVEVPANLGEGRHPAESMAERYLLLGDALIGAGDPAGAELAWRRARSGAGPLDVAPRPAGAADYFAGVAHLRLGEAAAAEEVWARLDARAEQLVVDEPRADYFATSLPELLLFDTDTSAARAETAHRLRTLAARGRGLTPAASGRVPESEPAR